MARTDMGVLVGEPAETTLEGENDLGHCILQLPTPALQTEALNSNRPVAFYFGAHITLSGMPESNDYFLTFGDQLGSLVFIFALHSKGDALPLSLLCLDVEYFKNWLFPNDGVESAVPPSNAWGIHNTFDFCEHNMQRGHTLTVHIDDKKCFMDKAVVVIDHLALLNNDKNYSFIFKIETNSGDEADDADDSGNEDDSNKEVSSDLTSAQKAAITRASNKGKSKSRYQAKRAKTTLPAGQFDVNAMLKSAQGQANSGTGAGARKSKVSKSIKPPTNPKPPPANFLDPAKMKTTTKQRKSGNDTGIEAMAAVTGVAKANHGSVTPTSNAAISSVVTGSSISKKTQRDDDESDFKLYHMKRMNDLAFFNEMNRVTDSTSRGRSQ